MRSRAPFFAFFPALFAAGCIYAPIDLGFQDIGKVQEVTLVDSERKEKILLLPIDGEISDVADRGNDLFGTEESTVAHVRDVLELAEKDDNVKAILLRINSPGGGVTASDVIYRELSEWKRKEGKPIVALMMDVAASGGYYVAQAADRIVAHPTCVTGSIGVIAFLPNISGLEQKIGVEVNVVKSGRMKDMGNPFRPFEEDERRLFQKLIDDMHARFVDVVADGRKRAGLGRAQVLALADGRVFTAEDAKKARLVDDVGYFQDALAATMALANLRGAKVITYERKGLATGRYTIYSRSRPVPVGASFLRGTNPPEALRIEVPGAGPARRPVLNYLWAPRLSLRE